MPVAAYSVSGEYTMLLAAGESTMIDKEELMLEMLTCIKRAGADLIVTYFAKAACSNYRQLKCISVPKSPETVQLSLCEQVLLYHCFRVHKSTEISDRKWRSPAPGD